MSAQPELPGLDIRGLVDLDAAELDARIREGMDRLHAMLDTRLAPLLALRASLAAEASRPPPPVPDVGPKVRDRRPAAVAVPAAPAVSAARVARDDGGRERPAPPRKAPAPAPAAGLSAEDVVLAALAAGPLKGPAIDRKMARKGFDRACSLRARMSLRASGRIRADLGTGEWSLMPGVPA